jgi:hypothetical protein
MKVKSPGKSDRHFILERENEHHLLEGSQASPARPSNKSTMEVKALEWLETLAWDKGRGILISELELILQ